MANNKGIDQGWINVQNIVEDDGVKELVKKMTSITTPCAFGATYIETTNTITPPTDRGLSNLFGTRAVAREMCSHACPTRADLIADYQSAVASLVQHAGMRRTCTMTT